MWINLSTDNIDFRPYYSPTFLIDSAYQVWSAKLEVYLRLTLRNLFQRKEYVRQSNY
jgi:hypothetical protein